MNECTNQEISVSEHHHAIWKASIDNFTTDMQLRFGSNRENLVALEKLIPSKMDENYVDYEQRFCLNHIINSLKKVTTKK
jgi:hypothetical protein